MKQLPEITKGIFFTIISAFCFALMMAFVKLSGDIFFVQKAFFRNFIAFLIALFSCILDLSKTKNKSEEKKFVLNKSILLFLFLRSIAGTVGIFGNYYAIENLVLSDATILNKMASFFTILFSFFLLKEKIKLVPFIIITIAFLGSMLIVKPSFDFSSMLPTLSGFASGVGAGFAYACVRKLGTLGCKGKFVVLFFSGFSSLVALPYIILNFNPMTILQWFYLIMAGVCAAGGQFSITTAYFHAPANKISIYDYSQIVFSAVLGFVLFGQLADIYSFAGYFIIILMAILNFLWNQTK